MQCGDNVGTRLMWSRQDHLLQGIAGKIHVAVLDAKDKRLLWLGTLSGAGAGIAVAFLAVAPEGIPLRRVMILVVLGIVGLLVPAYQLGCIKKSKRPKDLTKTVVTLVVVCGAMTILGWRASAVEPWCFLRPSPILPNRFVLWIDDPTSRPLEGVRYSMIEEPDPNETPERSMERARNRQLCKLGHVRASLPLLVPQECQPIIPLRMDRQNKFYFEIDSDSPDEIFFEELIADWDGKQWKMQWDLTRHSDRRKFLKIGTH